tara:strand:+ start:1131 stop:1865 length:735 start_codon:yes stop_codon:yes gene_type:complete
MNIVIVGGSSGIGMALSGHFSKKNNVFIGSKSIEKISSCIESFKNNSTNIFSGDCLDVSNFESVESFLDKASSTLGSIDVIINCAGSLLLKPPHGLREEEIDNVYKVNVYSCYALLKFGFKHMKSNGGSYVFFSSAASKVGLKNHEVISGAKGAVSSIALSAASTYANYNIRVNAIAPGLVETPLTEKITSNEVSFEYSKKLHGLNRAGKTLNFIPIVDSLINPDSDWITGQTICVDGGLSNVK